MPLVRDPANIRLGIAGKVDENDHPFSWSAILNGYEPGPMREFAHPVISDYLGAQAPENFGIPGVSVTHIWCDDIRDAQRIAQASKIETVVDRCEDLIGKVDAILIPTDRGDEHVRRARLFVEAGIPVFIDKPLCDNLNDLRQFEEWIAQGYHILSSSAMRYAIEFSSLRSRLSEIGELRSLSITMAKSWRRYGIHALEAIYPFLPPLKWTSLTNTGTGGVNLVSIAHQSGVCAQVNVGEDWFGGFGLLVLCGTRGHLIAQFKDSFTAFKNQLSAFIEYLRTGERPFPFDQTAELIRMLIAGQVSLARDGSRIQLNQLESACL